jgi:hypothetical protein
LGTSPFFRMQHKESCFERARLRAAPIPELKRFTARPKAVPFQSESISSSFHKLLNAPAPPASLLRLRIMM